MLKLEAWLAQRGASVAAALERQREPICDMVAQQLATSFPALCYDPARYDALSFQQQTFRETPRRFHRLLQVLLCLQSLQVIEREYSWGWPIVRRYGVERYHMLAQVRWYFGAASKLVILPPDDSLQMQSLAKTILAIIESVVDDLAHEPASETINHNGHNGFHP